MQKNEIETIVFGGGCFWCTEAIFAQFKGVISVESGYAGGTQPNPSYFGVSEGKTGHAEVVKVVFDPQVITLEQLLEVFFATHDPTTLNRQGVDVGTEYRSIILYTSEVQHKKSNDFIAKLQARLPVRTIVTEVKKLDHFYKAEEYHQKFFITNESSMYCQLVIQPKLEKLKLRFAHLLK